MAEYQLKHKVSTLVLIARFSSSAGEVKKSKVKICLIIISKKNITPIVRHRSQVSRKFFGEGLWIPQEVWLCNNHRPCGGLKNHTATAMTKDLLCYTCFNSGELAEKLGRYKMWKKKLNSPLAKQLSYRYLDILVYNCRIGHSSIITTEVNHYTMSNYVYKYT